jgi:hypothetical protein
MRWVLKLTSTNTARATAMAAFRCGRITGYALRRDDDHVGGPWMCAADTGLHSVHWRTRSLADARVWLRTATSANHFEFFSDPHDLALISGIDPATIAHLAPPHARIGGTPMLMSHLA